jgi:hypothetical protein
MKFRSFVLFSCFFMTFCICRAAGEGAKKMKNVLKTVEQDGLIMAASMPQKSIAGSAVNLKISLRNKRKKEIEFFLRGEYWDYDLKLVDAVGQPVPLTQYGKLVYGDYRRFGGSSYLLQLGPGKILEATVNVARVFDLTQEGEFFLSISLPVGVKIEKMPFKMIGEP